MKKAIVLLTCGALTLSSNVYAEGWLDSLKSLIGLGEKEQVEQTVENSAEQTVDALDISGMINQVTGALDVNTEQATGGIASLVNYAKTNLSSSDFSQLSTSLPGVSGILSKVPNISQVGSAQGLGGLLDTAAEYSDSVKSINDVKKQFEALGLKPEMITQFISQAQSYLDTEQGQQAKELLSQGLAKFMG